MCRLCEGATWDDVIADARLQIAVNGYMLFGVTGDDHYPWVYTAGLIDSGHPELIIASVSTETSAEILNVLAKSVIEGDRFEVGEHIGATARLVRIGAVDDVQYDLDSFAMWHRLRDAGVLHVPVFRPSRSSSSTASVQSTSVCSRCSRHPEGVGRPRDASQPRGPSSTVLRASRPANEQLAGQLVCIPIG